MDDKQLLRYRDQILLPQINVEGQQKLAQSKILIIGLGGLGAPVTMYLAAAGVGHLMLVDSDQVELSNLQRQIVHDTRQIGQDKTSSAQAKLQALNPDIQITILNQYLEGQALHSLVRTAHVVVDCSDNFVTRFNINAACVQSGTPLVSGAALRFNGQIAVFLPAQPHSPCYRCLYHEVDEQNETCSETGILAPVVGIVGSIQALEVIKVLLGIGESLCGKLLLFDARTLQWRTLKLYKDPVCPTCSPTNFAREPL